MLFINGIAFVCGIASHLLFFNRGRHHLHSELYVLTFLGLWVNTVGALVYLASWSVSTAILTTCWFNVSFLAGLYLSLCLYRTVFSPLHNFPGPFGACLSDLYLSVSVYRQDAYRQIAKLHEKYGEYIRIGSNTLSITNTEAVQAIYGNGSRCRKAPWYDLNKPIESLLTMRNKSDHDTRRRLWSTAFGDKALNSYEERIKPIQDQLIAHIESFGSQPFDVSKSFSFCSFDVMGDLAIHELARNPQHISLLRDEIFSHRYHESGTRKNQYLQYLPRLNSIIHETLRLHPAIPTAVPRLTPSEGLVVDGTFIPGDITVWCPQYALGRSERIYANASLFVPERWTTRPGLVKQQRAFAPFSMGPYGCIGRPLAMLNLRTALARLLLEFDMRGPDLIESGATEHPTLAPAPLLMELWRRKIQ